MVGGGVAPYSVSVSGAPDGMTVSPDGFISGTPTTAGTYILNVSATDSANISTTGSVSISIDLEPVVSGAGIITSLGASYMVVNGGLISTDTNVYYPTTTDAFTFLNGATLSVGRFITYTGSVDALGGVRASNVVVDIAPPALTFISSLSNGKVGTAYASVSLMATGIAPYAVTATGVPAGMSVSSAGVLSGTPAATGTYIIALSARDSAGTTGTGSVSITVDSTVVVPPTNVCGDDDDYHSGHGNNGNHYGWWNGYGHRDNDDKHGGRHRDRDDRQVFEGEGKITAVTSNAITVKNVLVRIIDETKIDLKKKSDVLRVGMKVEYEGVKNADGSITACEIEQD
jgi:hypothetical protein